MAKPAAKASEGEKLIVKNRRASFDYTLEEQFEAGLVLKGSEVKSLRAGTADLTDAWASVERDGVYLRNMTIQPHAHAAYPHETRRARKLLLNAREITEIEKGVDQGKMTLIPLRVYLKNGLVKVEIALARGKRKEDKREAIKSRDAKRETQAEMSRARKGG